MDVSHALEKLADYCRGMPPVAAMQVTVAGFEAGQLRLQAPLSANVNDKGTAFGGSLTSIMTVAGWGLVTMQLDLAGEQAEVYVADSAIRYLAPLRDDLLARAQWAEGEDWDGFLATLRQRGRARIQVRAWVDLPEGGQATTLEGRFVAIAKR